MPLRKAESARPADATAEGLRVAYHHNAMEERTNLVLTVHGINSDGEWQEDAGRVLEPHCTYASYKYRDYRYWGFVLQLVDPLPALLALAFAGAAATRTEGAVVPTPAETVVTAVGLMLTLLLLAGSLVAAMRPVDRPPSRKTFFWLLAISAACVATWSLSGPPRWSTWAAVGGAALLLAGLLEAWRRLPSVNNAKTWAVPLGASLLAVAGGSAMRRLIDTGMEIAELGEWSEPAQTTFVALAILASVAAIGRSFGRRRRNIDKLQRWILEKKAQSSPNVDIHLIAHSFGTFLVGKALENWREKKQAADDGADSVPSFSNVVVVGSAMRAGYPWADVIRAGLVRHVRNEVGGRDGVIRLAGLSFGFAPFAILGSHWHPFNMLGLGAAGYVGFKGPIESVHDVRNSFEFCEQCRIRDERRKPRVHNIWLPTFRHSDGVQATERAGRFWLPLILGFEPWEYWDFRRLCSQSMAHTERKAGLNREIEALKTQQERLEIAFRKSVDRPDERAQVNTDLHETEENLNRAQNELEKTQGRIEALIRQLGERTWDWTHASEGRAALHYYIANQVEDRWFQTEGSPRTDDAKNRSIKRAASERAWALLPRVVELSVAASEALRDVEQRGRSQLGPLVAEEKRKIGCLDPRAAVSVVVGDTPPPTEEEMQR